MGSRKFECSDRGMELVNQWKSVGFSGEKSDEWIKVIDRVAATDAGIHLSQHRAIIYRSKYATDVVTQVFGDKLDAASGILSHELEGQRRGEAWIDQVGIFDIKWLLSGYVDNESGIATSLDWDSQELSDPAKWMQVPHPLSSFRYAGLFRERSPSMKAQYEADQLAMAIANVNADFNRGAARL